VKRTLPMKGRLRFPLREVDAVAHDELVRIEKPIQSA
jgi:hypothetical protein